MNDTDGRPALERRVRSDLQQEATRLFPTHTMVPDPPADPGHAHHANWWLPLAAAVLVAAVALVTVRLHGGHQHASAGPPPSTISTPSPATTSPVPPSYPEATAERGVRVTPAVVPNQGPGAINTVTSFPKVKTLTIGKTYHFTNQLTDILTRPDEAEYVLTLTARNASFHGCPGPFVIRPGHTYSISCSVTLNRPRGNYVVSVTTLDGRPSSTARTPLVGR